MDNPRATVRAGYEHVAAAYLAGRAQDSPDVRALAQLTGVLSPGALVLDAGCGAGFVVAWSAFLADSLGDIPPQTGHLFVLARKGG